MRNVLHRLRGEIGRAACAAGLGMIALAGSAVCAEPLVRSGDTDSDIVLHDHAGWDRNCAAVAPPAVRLDAPPLHGTVCARSDNIRIEYVSYGTQTHCIGRMVHGVRLIYRPHAGYTGDDVVRYSVQYPKSHRDVSVKVTVLPATSGAAPARVAWPPRQDPGPIPACNDFVS